MKPAFDILIGTDFVGLIKGIKYMKDDLAGHEQLPPTVPPNFNYKQKVQNDIYIFFSFTKDFLTTV